MQTFNSSRTISASNPVWVDPTSEPKGFKPDPLDFLPPVMAPAPIPTEAASLELDPWDFLTQGEPIDMDGPHGLSFMSMQVWQLTWAVGELKRQIERLQNERDA